MQRRSNKSVDSSPSNSTATRQLQPAQLAPKPTSNAWEVDAPTDSASTEAGYAAFMKGFSSRRHGGGYSIPDLRFSSKEFLSKELFSLIVYDGICASAKGMPAFKNQLSKEEVEKLRAFIVDCSRSTEEKQTVCTESGGLTPNGRQLIIEVHPSIPFAGFGLFCQWSV